MRFRATGRHWGGKLAAQDGDYSDAVGVSAGAVAKWASVFGDTIL